MRALAGAIGCLFIFQIFAALLVAGAAAAGATPEMSPQEVLALANRPSAPSPFPAPISFNEIEASRVSYVPQTITPLADTDMNDINQARWMNRTDVEFLGESVNGAA